MDVIEAMARAFTASAVTKSPGYSMEDRMRAALAEAERLGWVMCPKEPTEAMLEIALSLDPDGAPDTHWDVMIAAAPKITG